MKWKIKLGAEARPETAATRLVWAVGYSADEDYFLREVLVRGMPLHLHRGQHVVGPNGTIRDVRVKREPDDRKKIGDWQWRNNPFSGARELNGLRVLMAVINNWDLKDVNNAIRGNRQRGTAVADDLVYEVSDLGSSFGSAGLERTDQSKGNLQAYSRTAFITKVTPNEVDFNVPRRPDWIVFANVPEFFMRLRLRLDRPRDSPRRRQVDGRPAGASFIGSNSRRVQSGWVLCSRDRRIQRLYSNRELHS
jgi:hypothetical protein